MQLRMQLAEVVSRDYPKATTTPTSIIVRRTRPAIRWHAQPALWPERAVHAT